MEILCVVTWTDQRRPRTERNAPWTTSLSGYLSRRILDCLAHLAINHSGCRVSWPDLVPNTTFFAHDLSKNFPIRNLRLLNSLTNSTRNWIFKHSTISQHFVRNYFTFEPSSREDCIEQLNLFTSVYCHYTHASKKYANLRKYHIVLLRKTPVLQHVKYR